MHSLISLVRKVMKMVFFSRKWLTVSEPQSSKRHTKGSSSKRSHKKKPVTPMSKAFYASTNQNLWKSFSQRKFRSERQLHLEDHGKFGIVQLLDFC